MAHEYRIEEHRGILDTRNAICTRVDLLLLSFL